MRGGLQLYQPGICVFVRESPITFNKKIKHSGSKQKSFLLALL